MVLGVNGIDPPREGEFKAEFDIPDELKCQAVPGVHIGGKSFSKIL